MKIAFDMVCTNLGSGTKTYVVNFCKQLSKKKIENKLLYIFISQKLYSEIQPQNKKNIFFIKKNNFLTISFVRILWMQFILPLELKFYKIDRLYSPMNIAPLILNLFKINSVLSLHTVIPWLDIKLLPGNFYRNLIMRFLMKNSIVNCKRLLVDSNYSKKVIENKLKIKSSKIKVLYLGVDVEAINNQKNKLDNFNYDMNYMLSVLSCTKYHNILKMLEGFKMFNDKNNEYKFVLVMQILDKKYYKEIIKFIDDNNLNKKVIIFSNLKNFFLTELYKNAQLYLFTSYSEVFGYTTLEAMSCGCPVLVSKTSALIEVNHNAAEFFDPNSASEISFKIEKILSDKKIYNELIRKGNNNLNRFNINSSFDHTFNSILSF